MCIHLILSCREDSFCTVWGTVCSSWVHMNSGTSHRSRLLPEGDVRKPYIRDANTMVSRRLACFNHDFQDPRMVLLLCLVVVRGGAFLLEQPVSSVMGEYFRFRWFTERTKAPCHSRSHG